MKYLKPSSWYYPKKNIFVVDNILFTKLCPN